ncbi:hypothetical protein FRX31_032944 [Thalictrum thalictroides]|uniref:Uncharacterized protein n=1 Tax=Thalictrum thalictroides TaxID=46969 RepID=A0A7J6UZJ3_THATH|nr:hypothetical protein FRX31_032944 [Thalictrum thalictroides]
MEENTLTYEALAGNKNNEVQGDNIPKNKELNVSHNHNSKLSESSANQTILCWKNRELILIATHNLQSSANQTI